MKTFLSLILVALTCFLTAQQIGQSENLGSCIKQTLLTYSEEANMHFSKKEYTRALEEYQKVIRYIQENRLSDPSNLLQAICGSMFCYDLLDQEPFAKAAFDELVYEVALLNERIDEIDWFRESPIYPHFVKNPNRYIQKTGLPETTPEEDCQIQCNGYALAAAFACGRLALPAVQFICYGCLGLNSYVSDVAKVRVSGRIVLRG
jgi:hypothetical protein